MNTFSYPLRFQDGVTPLHFAAEHGHVESGKILLKHGADKSASSRRVGNNPLSSIEVIQKEDVDVLIILDSSS